MSEETKNPSSKPATDTAAEDTGSKSTSAVAPAVAAVAEAPQPAVTIIRKGSPLTTLLALVGAIAGVGALTQPLWIDQARPLLAAQGIKLPGGNTSEFDEQALQSAVSSLESRVAENAGTGAALSEIQADIDDLRTQVAAAVAEAQQEPGFDAGAIATLETQIGTTSESLTGLRSDLGALRDRVEDLASRPSPESVTATAPVSTPAPVTGGGDTSALSADLSVLADRVGDLTTRLQAAQRDIARQGASLTPMQGVTTESLSALETEIAALTGRVDSLSEAILQTRSTLGTTSATLASRVGDLESRDGAAAQTASEEAALVLAIGQLREVLNSNQPFDRALDSVGALVVDKQSDAGKALSQLAVFAGDGVETRSVLFEDADEYARAAAAALQVGEDSSWVSKVTGRISSLVTVRRTDAEPDMTDPLNVLANFEETVQERDLAEATIIAKSMPNPSAAEVLEPWIAAAERRLNAETALETLDSLAIERLAAAKAETARRAGNNGEGN